MWNKYYSVLLPKKISATGIMLCVLLPFAALGDETRYFTDTGRPVIQPSANMPLTSRGKIYSGMGISIINFDAALTSTKQTEIDPLINEYEASFNLFVGGDLYDGIGWQLSAGTNRLDMNVGNENDVSDTQNIPETVTGILSAQSLMLFSSRALFNTQRLNAIMRLGLDYTHISYAQTHYDNGTQACNGRDAFACDTLGEAREINGLIGIGLGYGVKQTFSALSLDYVNGDEIEKQSIHFKVGIYF